MADHRSALLMSSLKTFCFGSGSVDVSRSLRRRRSSIESLETRECLSSTVPATSVHEVRHLAALTQSTGQGLQATETGRHSVNHASVHPQVKLLKTIYVRPGGKMGGNAGKSAAKPLGSINKALKMIKPGGTIILAPGVYTENVVVNNKSNITIVGAAGQTSILAPGSGDGIRLTSSNNITINNVRLKASQGRGLAVMGSSATLNNIKTDGTQGDGVVAGKYLSRTATVTANSCQFNGVQTGDGMDLWGGSSATINGCTFNGVGTAPNAPQSSNGLVLISNASATIVNSQFVGNTNGGLVAGDSSHVSAQGCTFASNKKGNGALFLGSAGADLRNNTFASNGEVVGPTTGLNGLELLNGFSGTAFISGNTFANNTANGIYVGGGVNTIQIVNNIFDNNYVGITMDTASGSTINAVVQGNTIGVPLSAPTGVVGILAIGHGLTGTIGGDGGLANTFNNYAAGTFIYIGDGDGNSHTAGFPNLTILTNNYLSNGQAVSPTDAIHHG